MKPWKLLLIAAVVTAFGARSRARPGFSAAVERPEGFCSVSSDERIFAYESVARFNETLIGTIDSIDTALTATLAGDIALAVFTIDKIVEFHSLARLAAIMLLGGSVMAAVAGYLFRFHAGVVDGIKPTFLVSDLSHRGEESMIGAIETLVRSSERNLFVRFVKRVLSALAILLLVAAVIVVGVARFAAVVVH